MGIMDLTSLSGFVEEGNPKVLGTIEGQIFDSIEFSKRFDLMPNFFLLPKNLPWRYVMSLRRKLNSRGFDAESRFGGNEKEISRYKLAKASGISWEDDIPQFTEIVLKVSPKQEDNYNKN